MAVAAVIGKVLQIVGGLAGTVGQYRSDIARAQQLKFEAQLAAQNAQLVKQDQGIVKETAQQERANISKQAEVLRGEARASFASGNVAVDEGSALDVDVAFAEQEAAELESSKDREALELRRLQIEKKGLLTQAQLKRQAAKEQKRGARLGAVGNTLSTVGGAVSSFGGK